MIPFLVIFLPLITLAAVGFGVCIGWRAAKDTAPIVLPSLPSIRAAKDDEKPAPSVKPQENP